MNAKVITLDTQGPRYLALSASAAAVGVALQPAPTYDARGVVFGTPEAVALRARVDYAGPGETWGAIGCTISHLNLYETLEETTLILEDDAVLVEGYDWPGLIPMVDASPFEIVFLHHHSHFGAEFGALADGLVKMPLRGQSVATCGYVMKAAAAARIIAMMDRNDQGEIVAPGIIDRLLARLSVHGFRIGIIKPYPVIHAGIDSVVEDSAYISGRVPVLRVPQLRVPQQITAWQAKAALAMTPAGEGLTMLDAANAIIDAMPEGPEKVLVTSAWDYNANFRRNSPTILGFAEALGLDSAALDALFIQGAALDV
jgi:hypothetical protein